MVKFSCLTARWIPFSLINFFLGRALVQGYCPQASFYGRCPPPGGGNHPSFPPPPPPRGGQPRPVEGKEINSFFCSPGTPNWAGWPPTSLGWPSARPPPSGKKRSLIASPRLIPQSSHPSPPIGNQSQNHFFWDSAGKKIEKVQGSAFYICAFCSMWSIWCDCIKI